MRKTATELKHEIRKEIVEMNNRLAVKNKQRDMLEKLNHFHNFKNVYCRCKCGMRDSDYFASLPATRESFEGTDLCSLYSPEK